MYNQYFNCTFKGMLYMPFTSHSNPSLVDHGVIRCGEGVSPRPYLDEELYSSHLSTHKKVAFPIPTECAEYMDKVIDSVRSLFLCTPI